MKWWTVWFFVAAVMAISPSGGGGEKDVPLDLLQSLYKKMTFLEETNMKAQQAILHMQQEINQLRQNRNTDHPESKANPKLSLETRAPGAIMRSCIEYLENDPTLQSDNYLIDPDGIGSGDAAFEVYCNMSTGSTNVPHDTEDATNVPLCLPPGCYSRQVTYSTTNRQLKALKVISDSCRQRIQYDCVSAPLQFNGIDYSYWKNNDGGQFNYWSGSGDSGHICDCGINSDCVDNSLKCNCDADLSDPYSDAGYLTNKDHLPVGSLYFGRLASSDSVGTHTLGKLECFGKSIVSGKPTSCTDLWKMGHYLSGYYMVRNPLSADLKIVYCNMDQLFNEGFEEDTGCSVDCPAVLTTAPAETVISWED